MNKLIHRQIDNIIVHIIAMAWYALWNKNYSAVEYGVGHDLELLKDNYRFAHGMLVNSQL